MKDPACDLCIAERITTWHHEDEHCFVADCEVCGVPMVVWRSHGSAPPEDDVSHMIAVLQAVGERVLGESFRIDPVMRQIPDHFHAHARPSGWWFKRFTHHAVPGAGGASPG